MKNTMIVYCPKCKNPFNPNQVNDFFEGNYIVCNTCKFGFRRYISSDKEPTRILNVNPRCPRYDPITGEDIYPENKKINIKNIFSRKNLKKTAQKIQISLNEAIFNRIFSVLDPSIRNQLKDLNLTEAERALIAKSFIYLSREQQQKYIDEIKTLQIIDDEKENPSKDVLILIENIKSIPIPENQKDYLINQLNYIPEAEKKKFIIYLQKKI